ncbi:hypothetical protein A9G13_08975 [Gilliamella sp. wkB178]|uniref:hypothetical protein n=1 Tax=Gilliamella sp. wkB178 TaxID=3120259 RepID=UPI00080D91F1|nr:hypothetical protein [Gilliamella apicola]OCG07104.1 hypothetical protein A9G13_08975 [Gilliamella apicola]
MQRVLIGVTLFLLVGCGSLLNYRTAPLVMQNCQYTTRPGVEFLFNPLPANISSYQHVYIAQSRDSRVLPAEYAGMRGKLTNQFFVRDYPKETFWRAQTLLERATLYDDGYDDVYISPQQKEDRDRKAKFVVRKAILQNCQVVYIAIDSLTTNRDNPQLIEAAGLTIIK